MSLWRVSLCLATRCRCIHLVCFFFCKTRCLRVCCFKATCGHLQFCDRHSNRRESAVECVVGRCGDHGPAIRDPGLPIALQRARAVCLRSEQGILYLLVKASYATLLAESGILVGRPCCAAGARRLFTTESKNPLLQRSAAVESILQNRFQPFTSI